MDNIAVRMVWDPRDAEDVTQEVLIKVITKLSSFQGQSKFRTWLYRIVANHIINMKCRGHELEEYNFAGMGDELDRTPDADLPDPKTVPVDLHLLVEEAKIGCVTADAALPGSAAATRLRAGRNVWRERSDRRGAAGAQSRQFSPVPIVALAATCTVS